MKERPILMSTEPVKAILDGRKTQTRRTAGLEEINKNPDLWVKREAGQVVDSWLFWHRDNQAECIYLKCPYGQVGDRLYVRETFQTTREQDCVLYKADYSTSDLHAEQCDFGNWRPSIHMPRWASRILLEITELRVERLQDITEEDAKAEGANPYLVDKLSGGTKYRMLKTYHHDCYPLVDHADEGEIVTFQCPNLGFARLTHTQWKDRQDPVFRIPSTDVFDYVGAVEPDYKNGFRILWNSINAKRGYSWASNPFCWVLSFRKLD